jgi:diguanylate cyclase (GGDEF)-like protein
VSWAVAAVTALLCFSASAYGAASARRCRILCARIDALELRQTEAIAMSRLLAGASRRSPGEVLETLDRELRVLEPSIDATLVFTPAGDELLCAYAAGGRAAHFLGARISREGDTLPARAALKGHRIDLSGGALPLIPTDRSAVAVPMLCDESPEAVVYLGSLQRLAAADSLACAVARAAYPYRVAAEREADRARATFDALTGLVTPRAFRETLTREIRAAAAGAAAVIALWFVDTDHFKAVNDTFGHASGDVVLQRMASLLREKLTPADLPARNGGDEFCAILRGGSKIGAIERAQAFCDAVRSCDFGSGIRLSASIGVSCYPHDARDAGQLLEIADAAMYHSKRSGRSRVSFAHAPGAYTVYRE